MARDYFILRQVFSQTGLRYTASDAFFEALWELGIKHCFVNLGSDHPSLLEAIVRGQRDKPNRFPNIVTCPNEMVALSMADGYARYTNEPQCVIVHVDVGTQGLGAAVHNASCGRAPVLIFAGLSPYTCEGELRGSRTEYIHWIQDVPDQGAILKQYCRYSGEIRRGVNIKQMVGRAYQFAMSDPKGPVYLVGAREAMEEEIESYPLEKRMWEGIGPAALPEEAVHTIAKAFKQAEEPLVITGYSGRDHAAVKELIFLAHTFPNLGILDTGGSDMCMPNDHQSYIGLRYGIDESVTTADVILVAHCDVPWIPTRCKPKPSARIFHIDSDPLKQQMPVFYLPSEGRWKADAAIAFNQIRRKNLSLHSDHNEWFAPKRRQSLIDQKSKRNQLAEQQAQAPPSGNLSPSYLAATIRRLVPSDTIFAIEAVTLTPFIADQLRPTIPGTWLNCGGGGLGWSGGAALGIKLATKDRGEQRFLCQIVGDGTFLFSVPSSVYWISQRYNLPVLTVVLNNKGWNAPRRSLLAVHPEGEGSRVSNRELHIEFEPGPDYAGIAKASAGGRLWAGKASTVEELEGKLGEAVESVKGGVGAVLEAVLESEEPVSVGGKGQQANEGEMAG